MSTPWSKDVRGLAKSLVRDMRKHGYKASATAAPELAQLLDEFIEVAHAKAIMQRYEPFSTYPCETEH